MGSNSRNVKKAERSQGVRSVNECWPLRKVTEGITPSLGNPQLTGQIQNRTEQGTAYRVALNRSGRILIVALELHDSGQK